MKKLLNYRLMAATLICGLLIVQGAWAQGNTTAGSGENGNVQPNTATKPEPSLTLTKIKEKSECTVYKFNYPSVSATGEQTVLSSALLAWTPSNRRENDSIESLHIFCHITITDDNERPTTSGGASKEQSMLLLLPGRGYGTILTGEYASYVGRCIVIAPDYEGYGVTKDAPHPYLAQRLTAQQVIDAVRYGLELYKKEVTKKAKLLPMKSDWRSFCIGYSQGGAVSLATHRQIEEQGLADELHFQGSICGDGPYDLIETMRYFIEDDGTSYGVETSHRKGLATLPLVMPLILKGMSETHPDMKPYGIENIMSQQLLDTGVLGWIDSKAYNTDEIAKKWYDQLQAGVDTLDRHYTPEQMGELFESPKADKVWGKVEKVFAPAVYDYLLDASHFDAVPEAPADAPQALHSALADNSVTTGWEPLHRIQFFYSKADIIVPYGNYLAFRDVHPQGEGSLYRIDDIFSNGNHLDAGAMFLGYLLIAKKYASVFNWLCETPIPTQITDLTVLSSDGSLSPAWQEASWYTLDGRHLSGKPAQKGGYVNKGKKIIIK